MTTKRWENLPPPQLVESQYTGFKLLLDELLYLEQQKQLMHEEMRDLLLELDVHPCIERGRE